LILRACLRGAVRLRASRSQSEKETAPIRSTKSCGERLIKTFFKKIVHNKNDISSDTVTTRAFTVDFPAILAPAPLSNH
jgi:hypothetical protein